MLDYIYQVWVHNIWLPYISTIKYLESKPAGIYVVIIVLVILAIIQTKLIRYKTPKTPETKEKAETTHKKKTKKEITLARKQLIFKLLDFIFTIACLVTVALIVGVCYLRFSPAISDFFKDDTKPTNNTKTTTTTTDDNTQKQNTTDGTTQIQTPKQLYYFCSCSGCYAEGCPRNGYSYSGYSETNYLYYRSLCQACSCTSSYARSYWR